MKLSCNNDDREDDDTFDTSDNPGKFHDGGVRYASNITSKLSLEQKRKGAI